VINYIIELQFQIDHVLLLVLSIVLILH